MQRHHLGGVPERLRALRAERARDRRPHRTEDLVARTDRDRHPRHAHLEVLRPRIDKERPRLAVQPLEDAVGLEMAGEVLGHLPAQDGPRPGLIGLVLPAGEREHPRGPVLDGHRGVEERRHRVGHGEQIPGRHPVQGPRRGVAEILLGQHGAEHRGELRP